MSYDPEEYAEMERQAAREVATRREQAERYCAQCGRPKRTKDSTLCAPCSDSVLGLIRRKP